MAISEVQDDVGEPLVQVTNEVEDKGPFGDQLAEVVGHALQTAGVVGDGESPCEKPRNLASR